MRKKLNVELGLRCKPDVNSHSSDHRSIPSAVWKWWNFKRFHSSFSLSIRVRVVNAWMLPWSPFRYREICFKTFVGQAVIFFVNCKRGCNNDETPATELKTIVFSFVIHRAAFLKSFILKCMKICNSQKKLAKDSFLKYWATPLSFLPYVKDELPCITTKGKREWDKHLVNCIVWLIFAQVVPDIEEELAFANFAVAMQKFLEGEEIFRAALMKCLDLSKLKKHLKSSRSSILLLAERWVY